MWIRNILMSFSIFGLFSTFLANGMQHNQQQCVDKCIEEREKGSIKASKEIWGALAQKKGSATNVMPFEEKMKQEEINEEYFQKVFEKCVKECEGK